jgi:hypothetical protein
MDNLLSGIGPKDIQSPQVDQKSKISSENLKKDDLRGKVKKDQGRNRLTDTVQTMESNSKLGETKKMADKYDKEAKSLVKGKDLKISSDKKTSDLNNNTTTKSMKFKELKKEPDKIVGIFEKNHDSKSKNTKDSANLERQRNREAYNEMRQEFKEQRALERLSNPIKYSPDNIFQKRQLDSPDTPKKPKVEQGSPGIQRRGTFKIKKGEEDKVTKDGALQDPNINIKATKLYNQNDKDM